MGGQDGQCPWAPGGGSCYACDREPFAGVPGPALGGAGPNWEQFQSAQVPSQLAPRSWASAEKNAGGCGGAMLS